MDKVVLMHVLEARYHLLTQHADCLESKFTAAVLEQILERVAKKFHNHRFVVTFDSIPQDIWNTLAATKKSIKLVLVLKLRKLRPDRFQFYGTLIIRLNMTTFVNFTEGSASDFFNKLIYSADSQIHFSDLYSKLFSRNKRLQVELSL